MAKPAPSCTSLERECPACRVDDGTHQDVYLSALSDVIMGHPISKLCGLCKDRLKALIEARR